MGTTTNIAGQILQPDPDHLDSVRLRGGVITIDQSVITAIEFDDQIDSAARNADLGGPDHLIFPGLVDCHVHLPQFDIIGAHGMPLLQWLGDVTFPAELGWADTDVAVAAIDRALDQLQSVGTTAIAAYATNHAAAASAALRIASRRGFRGVIGQVLMDRDAPDGLLQDPNAQIDQTAELLNEFPPGQPIAAAVTPRFAVSCSERLLVAAGQIADQTGAVVQTHLAETIPECELIRQLFDGDDYVDVYAKCNLLSPRTIFGHGIHLSQNDRGKLASSGSMIAHCPTANRFLGAGAMNRHALMADGVGVCLGSDVGAGFERSMIRVARSMILTAASRGQTVPTAAQAWWQITHGNASSIAMPSYGINVGAEPNLVIAKPTIPWRDGLVDPLARLMFAWDDRWIEQVMGLA